MNSENPRSRSALSKEMISLQDEYLKSVRRSKMDFNLNSNYNYNYNNNYNCNYNNRRPLKGKRILRYFTMESLFLLVCLTVSLLVLPVVLPPLPPPPLPLLLLPILILAVLMLLAVMPFGGRELTHAYA